MKFGKVLLVAAIAALTVTQSARADDLYLGDPAYAGSGCPAGSAAAVLSPDRKTLSVLFDSYIAQAGSAVGRSIDRKNCTLAIPVHVPQGYSISLYKVDYRGYVYAPQGGAARFNVEYFFAGYPGPRTQRTFLGPVDSEFMLTNNLVGEALVWSPCGADTNLRINSAMTAQTNRLGQDVLASVDSVDVRAGIIYQIQWRRCAR